MGMGRKRRGIAALGGVSCGIGRIRKGEEKEELKGDGDLFSRCISLLGCKQRALDLDCAF